MLKITCQKPGFRRAGRAWPAESLVAASDFTPEQIEALESEPMLKVEAVGSSSGQSQGAVPTGSDPRLVVVMAMLAEDTDQTDESLWTKAKAPELPELNRRLAEQGLGKVTAKERDALWAEVTSHAAV
jgi:hypothetical protein